MMNEYKNAISLTSQFSFCGLPIRLDTYSGCSFKCRYCFFYSRNGNFKTDGVKIANPDKVIQKFENSFRQSKKSVGLISQCIKNRMPIHFGGMSDPFQKIEAKYNVTLEVLKYLSKVNYPIVISTKSTLLIEDKYINELRKMDNVILQFSFSTLDSTLAPIVEPNCDSTSERLRVIKELSKYGIKTSIRWQPYIPNFSETPREFVSKIKDLGINHLIIEYLKVPIDNKISWGKHNDVYRNILSYYNKNDSKIIGRELVLNIKLKIQTIFELQNELKNSGITLGVGENEVQFLSDTKCCCGVDKFDGFNNWYKFQISYAINNPRKNKVYFSQLDKQWRPSGSIDKFINSKSRIKRKSDMNTITDYLVDRWEELNSGFNPSKICCVNNTGFRDKKGFRIFAIDKKKLWSE